MGVQADHTTGMGMDVVECGPVTVTFTPDGSVLMRVATGDDGGAAVMLTAAQVETFEYELRRRLDESR